MTSTSNTSFVSSLRPFKYAAMRFARQSVQQRLRQALVLAALPCLRMEDKDVEPLGTEDGLISK